MYLFLVLGTVFGPTPQIYGPILQICFLSLVSSETRFSIFGGAEVKKHTHPHPTDTGEKTRFA